MMTVINGFVCPSDCPDPIPSLGGQTNYMANMGSGIVWQSAIGPNVGLPQPNGVFYGDSATTFAAITDGLSNTTFFSERVLADGNNAIVSPIADVFFSPGSPTTPDDAMQTVPGRQYLRPEQPVPALHGRPLALRPAYLPSRHAAQHSLLRVLHLSPRGHAAEQPPPRRCEHSFWATGRSSSSRTRSTCQPGVLWAPEPAARSSAPTVTDTTNHLSGR